MQLTMEGCVRSRVQSSFPAAAALAGFLQCTCSAAASAVQDLWAETAEAPRVKDFWSVLVVF